MAVNKVVYNTENGAKTLIDLTNDSVTPETLAEGVTAHDASGEVIIGTMPTDVVRYGTQILTEAQKEQARENIGIGDTFKTEVATYVLESIGCPLFGVVDENNDIIVSGNLADGTYTLKYENEDGTYTDIGSLVIGGYVPTVIPIIWNEGKACGYSVGSSYALTANASYCTSDVIELESGVTYTLTVNATNATSFRFVGANDNGIVTETINHNVVVGNNTFTFTPSGNTTQMRIRSYASVSGWGWTLTK